MLVNHFMSAVCLPVPIRLLSILLLVDGFVDSTLLFPPGAAELSLFLPCFSSFLGSLFEQLRHPFLVLDCGFILLPLKVSIQNAFHIILGTGVGILLQRIPVFVNGRLAGPAPSICNSRPSRWCMPLASSVVHPLREGELLGTTRPPA